MENPSGMLFAIKASRQMRFALPAIYNGLKNQVFSEILYWHPMCNTSDMRIIEATEKELIC